MLLQDGLQASRVNTDFECCPAFWLACRPSTVDTPGFHLRLPQPRHLLFQTGEGIAAFGLSARLLGVNSSSRESARPATQNVASKLRLRARTVNGRTGIRPKSNHILHGRLNVLRLRVAFGGVSMNSQLFLLSIEFELWITHWEVIRHIETVSLSLNFSPEAG